MKIVIWCCISKVELKLLEFTLENLIKNDNIYKICILITDAAHDNDEVPEYLRSQKISIFKKNFGKGYNISIDEGGYDQVAARNECLKEAERYKDKWLLQFDADDFYDDKFIQKISEIKSEKIDGIVYSCVTPISEYEVWSSKRKVRKINGYILYDPHMRIWSSALKLRFDYCDNAKKYFKNKSRHCGINFKKNKNLNIFYFDEIGHYHFHCILKKRNSKRLSEEKMELKIKFNKEVIYLMNKLKQMEFDYEINYGNEYS